jgi:hypothetical protein
MAGRKHQDKLSIDYLEDVEILIDINRSPLKHRDCWVLPCAIRPMDIISSEDR